MRNKYAKEFDRRATELLRDYELWSPVDVAALAERLGAMVAHDG